MKNDRIIAAWNTIEPDGAADARMLSAILLVNHAAQNRKERMKNMMNIKRILIPVAACLALLAVIGIGINRNWFGTGKETAELQAENSEAEISEGAPVNDVEIKVPISYLDEETDAAFGYLFPTEIMEGYVLNEEGFAIYSDSADALHAEYRTLQAVFYNAESDDTLLIKAITSDHITVREYGTVLYGDPQIDGTRSSMIYYENDGITILYRFEKTDIAAMDPETAERFYAMVHSARCFDRDSENSYEGNDKIDMNG